MRTTDTSVDRLGIRPDPLTEAVLAISPDSKDFRESLLNAIRTNLQDGFGKASIASRNLTDQTILQLKAAIRSRNGAVVKTLLCGLLRDMPTVPEDPDLEPLTLPEHRGHPRDPNSVMCTVRNCLRLALLTPRPS